MLKLCEAKSKGRQWWFYKHIAIIIVPPSIFSLYLSEGSQECNLEVFQMIIWLLHPFRAINSGPELMRMDILPLITYMQATIISMLGSLVLLETTDLMIL